MQYVIRLLFDVTSYALQVTCIKKSHYFLIQQVK